MQWVNFVIGFGQVHSTSDLWGCLLDTDYLVLNLQLHDEQHQGNTYKIIALLILDFGRKSKLSISLGSMAHI